MSIPGDQAVTNDDLLKALKSIESKLSELAVLKRYELMGPERVMTFLCEDQEISMYLPDADRDFIQRGIMASARFFEFPMLQRIKQFVPKGSTVYDLGANIGNHSVYFSSICGAERVVAVEAQTHCHAVLRRNLELNSVNGIAHHCLLGVEGGFADMGFQNAGNLGATSFEISDSGSMPMVSVDTLASDEERLDFMKIDVEGMQIEVLKGAEGTIRKHQPILWIELREKFGELEPTAELLEPMGYVQKLRLSPNDFVFAPAA